MKVKFVLSVILNLVCLQLQAHTIVLKESADAFNIFNQELEILEDPDGVLDITQVLANQNKLGFIHFNEQDCYSKNPGSTYWLRFKILDSAGSNFKWVFEILDSRFDEVTLYTPDLNNPQTYLGSTTGIMHPFDSRQYGHKNFIFNLPVINDNQTHYYYLKIKPGVVGSFLFKIGKSNVFATYAFKEYILLGMYYGILLIMAFYNLFVFFSIREKVYLYYFLYVIAWAFNSTLDDSIGYQYIWSDTPAVSRAGFYFSKIAVLAAFTMYAQSFLNLKEFTDNKKRFYSILLFFIITNFVLIYFNMSWIDNLISTIVFAYISYQSYIVYKKGYRPARFFLLGNGIIVIGLFFFFVKSSGIYGTYIDQHPNLHIFLCYIKNVIMVVDIVILSIALSDRMRYLKTTAALAQEEAYNQLNEKKLLSEKVNRELEQKVSERTKELEEQKQVIENANKKLKEQAEEITKMNALLDLDNWNLKKNIIHEKEARIMDKEINFEEFQQVYPDDMACYRFLDEIKQEQGFKCRKCGSTKFGKGLSTFSRRCNDCRYDESVTAYTVFHGCKFKIQTAMYIAVMINRYGKEIPISHISKEVKLRNGTCTKFAQRLLATREIKEYLKKSEKERIKVLILNTDVLAKK